MRPVVEALPTFGGPFFDESEEGKLTILLTSPDAKVSDAIASLMPAGQAWEIREVTFTRSELMEALERAADSWSRSAIGIKPLGFGLDTRNNGLFVEVVQQDLATAGSGAEALASDLGVPVAVRVGTPGRDTHCSTRDHCHGPMKSGNNIYKGFNYSGGWCTMGFHISIGVDEQFVTAGHCGFRVRTHGSIQRFRARLEASRDAVFQRRPGHHARFNARRRSVRRCLRRRQ